jgi:hypothetical protein
LSRNTLESTSKASRSASTVSAVATAGIRVTRFSPTPSTEMSKEEIFEELKAIRVSLERMEGADLPDYLQELVWDEVANRLQELIWKVGEDIGEF